MDFRNKYKNSDTSTVSLEYFDTDARYRYQIDDSISFSSIEAYLEEGRRLRADIYAMVSLEQYGWEVGLISNESYSLEDNFIMRIFNRVVESVRRSINDFVVLAKAIGKAFKIIYLNIGNFIKDVKSSGATIADIGATGLTQLLGVDLAVWCQGDQSKVISKIDELIKNTQEEFEQLSKISDIINKATKTLKGVKLGFFSLKGDIRSMKMFYQDVFDISDLLKNKTRKSVDEYLGKTLLGGYRIDVVLHTDQKDSFFAQLPAVYLRTSEEVATAKGDAEGIKLDKKQLVNRLENLSKTIADVDRKLATTADELNYSMGTYVAFLSTWLPTVLTDEITTETARALNGLVPYMVTIVNVFTNGGYQDYLNKMESITSKFIDGVSFGDGYSR